MSVNKKVMTTFGIALVNKLNNAKYIHTKNVMKNNCATLLQGYWVTEQFKIILILKLGSEILDEHFIHMRKPSQR